MKRDLILFYSILILGLLIFFHQKVGETGVSIMEKVTGYVKGLYDDLYQKWGALRGLDWMLIKAVAQQESGEDPNAIGDNGQAVGLMQVWHWHWEALGMSREDMLDPNLNLQAATAYLATMVNKFGTEGGLEAYNEGEGNYIKGVSDLNYSNAVLKRYYAIQNAQPVASA